VIEGMSSPAPGKWVAIFVVFHATFLPTLLYVARWSLFRWRDSSRRHRALAWTSLSILAVLGALDHFAWLFWMDRFDKTLWAGTQIFILVPSPSSFAARS
jgi:hypothetical protein